MASITIQHGHKNLLFAAAVANSTGATFDENGQWITISDSPELTIPRYDFDEIFDERGRNPSADRLWRSLLLNKSGYLKFFDDHEIVITDEKPTGDKRPQFLLRFPDEGTKQLTESYANRLGYTLTDYVLSAIETYNQQWEEQVK